MRHHMCPDEAFGMVFNLDNVIANTKTRQHAAWQRLAQLEGLPPPQPDRPLFDLRPERVITDVSMPILILRSLCWQPWCGSQLGDVRPHAASSLNW